MTRDKFFRQECGKCAWGINRLTHDLRRAAFEYIAPRGGNEEALRVTCARCGYVFDVKPFDAESKTTEGEEFVPGHKG